jgi:hypothetical protein
MHGLLVDVDIGGEHEESVDLEEGPLIDGPALFPVLVRSVASALAFPFALRSSPLHRHCIILKDLVRTLRPRPITLIPSSFVV